MISISQWGLIEAANMEVDSYQTAGWIREQGVERDFYAIPAPNCMPAWWAGSAAYQALNFGPYLS